MKKLFRGAAALTAFSLSIILFQVACRKGTEAATPVTVTQQNKIIYGKYIYGDSKSAATVNRFEIWTANYDGTAQAKVNLTLPTDAFITSTPKLSPDGKLIFFSIETFLGGTSYATKESLYACNIDGSNVHVVIPADATAGYEIGQAY